MDLGIVEKEPLTGIQSNAFLTREVAFEIVEGKEAWVILSAYCVPSEKALRANSDKMNAPTIDRVYEAVNFQSDHSRRTCSTTDKIDES